MTRSKQSVYNNKHERHVARNGLTDIRSPVKKSGGGYGNWGNLTDEIANVDE
ncbi:uncharacterized protein BX664DRAFT_340664 [Halteromyces radiatus]|uniref:uncharacterized protein n=1 Tax=Halteromyces radiatus TaxID=101107 RepID=UPI002220C808|nr:uncharacterized protein BX664DRAFT_340664 [Halteromyces radiatus]KAI8081541.1 hypothetical protein BX664DRAFT_340664 [Halteromyces radiatus]